jgi:hypothetical protein
MNVQIMQMDPRIASIHFRDYQIRCRKHRLERKATLDAKAKEAGQTMRRLQIEKSRMEKEDRQLLLTYKALKEGQRLIHLPNAIRSGGWTKNWLPKLAIARASAKHVVFNTGNTPYFEGGPWESKVVNRVDMTRNIFPAEITNAKWREDNRHPIRATALVPTIPPHLRPDDISKYHILWEAEWTFNAPGDPILLSKVNDDMYAVIAQWDLTPVEQMILESRTLY